MCLAVPAEIISLDESSHMATVSLGGIRRDISIALVPGVAIGDYVIVHVGYAIQKLDTIEAERTLHLMNEGKNIIPQAQTGNSYHCTSATP